MSVKVYPIGLEVSQTPGAFRQQTYGADLIDPDGNAPAIGLAQQDGTRLGFLQFNAASDGTLRCEVDGGEIVIECEDSGGTLRAGALRVGTASSATAVGFHNTAPIIKPAVTGSRSGNAALASLLTALANYGLLTDSSSA